MRDSSFHGDPDDQGEPCSTCGGSGVESEHVDDDGMMTLTPCPACHVPLFETQPWHVINSADLLAMLRRCHAGEDPEMVYLEEYVNAERPTEDES